MKIEWNEKIQAFLKDGKYYISFKEDTEMLNYSIVDICKVSDFSLEEQCFIESIDDERYEVMLNDGMIEDEKEVKAKFKFKVNIPQTVKRGKPFMILYVCFTKPSGEVIYEDKSFTLYCKDGSVNDKNVALYVLGDGTQELVIKMKG